VLALGRPVRVTDYVSSPAITHHFDAQVRGEGLAAMLAVPIVARGETVAIAYAAMREPADFGDDAVRRMEEVACQAGAALHLAKVAETDRLAAVAGERLRMQSALHDSVGALLFSVGVQVRNLHEDVREHPGLEARLHRLEGDVSAAAGALRESLLALSESSPERALPVELAEHWTPSSLGSRLTITDVARACFSTLSSPSRTADTSSAVRSASSGGTAASCTNRAGTPQRAWNERQVVVADDGTGTEVVPGTGMGLRTLSGRAARLGGRVSLVRDDDDGSTLRAWVPLVRP
jgi:signal transduction histidine kinase